MGKRIKILQLIRIKRNSRINRQQVNMFPQVKEVFFIGGRFSSYLIVFLLAALTQICLANFPVTHPPGDRTGRLYRFHPVIAAGKGYCSRLLLQTLYH